MGTTVVVVLESRRRLRELRERLAALQPPPLRLVAVGAGETPAAEVTALNPAHARHRRQRSMALWLIPFGFLAGLTFTQITDLHTFSALGPWGEPLVGGLLGMGSGWLGSFVAAASVPSEGDDRVRTLRNRLEEGSWLLLLEPAPGTEVPWALLREAQPKALVRLEEG
ncbi:MAG: hypothetical protein VKL58_00440 [Cyanobacteriota bacterium]|nr:hypothetical protein [Cyanobacteriota bacterium]